MKNFPQDVLLFKSALSAFLSSGLNNTWINVGEDAQLYVRKATRSIGGKRVTTLDVANIHVAPHLCGHGLGTALIDAAHELNPFEATYIENVLEARFANHLLRQEWLTANSAFDPLGWDSCFYKLKGRHGHP